MIDYNESLKKLYEENIRAHSEGANDILKRWITMLTLGNGAALLGSVNIVSQPANASFLPVLIVSLWLFLIGIIFGGGCFLYLGSSWRSAETYWRLSDADRRLREGNLDEQNAAEIAKADENEDKFAKWAAHCAIAACISFVAGIALPLIILTTKVVRPLFAAG